MNNQTFFHIEIEKQYSKLRDELLLELNDLKRNYSEYLSGVPQYSLPADTFWGNIYYAETDDLLSANELSSEVKESLVLNNKEMIEQMLLSLRHDIETIQSLKIMFKKIEIILRAIAIDGDFQERNVRYGLLFNEYPDFTLKLTGLELFTALKLLPEDVARKVLETMRTDIFSHLLKCIKEDDVRNFIAVYESAGIDGIENLNRILYPFVDKSASFGEYLVNNLSDWECMLDLFEKSLMDERVVEAMEELVSRNGHFDNQYAAMSKISLMVDYWTAYISDEIKDKISCLWCVF